MFRRVSLSLKLSVAFFVTIVLSVVLVYILTASSVSRRFDSYNDARRQEIYRIYGAQLTMYWQQSRSWVGVEQLFIRSIELHLGVSGQVVQGAAVFRSPFTLANEEGKVILTTRNDVGRKLTAAEMSSGPIVVNDLQVGTFLIFDTVDPEEMAFLASAKRSALIGGGITTAIALAVSIFFIARILSPLRALTRATESIAEGQAPQKVTLKSRDEIGQLGESFDHMVESLGRSERLRQTMTADIAHEIRTPVTIIQGTLEAILDGVYEPTPETIAPIYEETLHMGKLIDDLRELAMAEAGELRLHRESVDVGRLVQQIIDATAPALEGAPRVRIAVEEAPAAMIDPKRFRQVMANLLGNAMRYTPSDGFIDIAVRGLGNEVEVSVSDTGPGISPEDLDHIFERFFRGDASRSRAVGGSGLGLAIVKQWVEAHGGRVWAENRLEGGARFTLRLPIA
jgi:signal transduction histidine kinase